MLPFLNEPGVYLIQCTVNGATYTGSTLNVQRRLVSHITALRSGTSTAYHLQRDWNQYGESAFVFYGRYHPADELWYKEIELTLMAHSLDDHGGYNKMLANQEWSLSARIKNTESKLHKKKKFSFLPGISPMARLDAPYIKTVCPTLSTRTLHECNPKLHERLDRAAAAAALKVELEGYQRFPSISSDEVLALNRHF